MTRTKTSSLLGIAESWKGSPSARGMTFTGGAVLAAVVVGVAASRGGLGTTLAKSLAVVALVGPFAWVAAQRYPMAHRLRIEIPTLLLLFSGIVLRQRDAESLASNPLDTAGLFRVVFVGAALVIGILTLTERSLHRADAGRVTSRPFRLYALYVLVVFIGAPLSVNLPLTAYRGVELLAGVVVVAGAFRVAGREGAVRIERAIFCWLVVMLLSVWVGAVLFPSLVISRLSTIESPIPWQIQGVYPVISSNGVGTFGVLVGIWSVGALVSPREPKPIPRKWLKWTAVLGFATLAMAQYRTGYVAAVLAVIVLLFVRANVGALAWLLLGGAIVAVIFGTVIIETVAPVALRGETISQASDLNSRTFWWSASIPVWEQSPLFGRGLLTGTRFEVLAQLGRTTTSTIHSMWIEALVGTGVVGVALIASSGVITLGRGIRSALRDERLVPALIMVVLFVRSLTGSSFEEFGSTAILFMALAIGMRDEDVGAFGGVRPEHAYR
jgi:O-antigen ligase